MFISQVFYVNHLSSPSCVCILSLYLISPKVNVQNDQRQAPATKYIN